MNLASTSLTSLSSSITLNSGTSIPAIGLGVYKIPNGESTEQAVLWALSAGYRHIDTASFYGNEESVGAALRKSTIPREEIFLTTKLWPTDFFSAEKACATSLKKLGTTYIDLYLIHWPSPVGKDRAWKSLVRLQQSGLCKAIGVSNYSIAQLQALEKSSTILPAVNQIECSPFRIQKELREYCQAKNIQIEAYSPLTRGQKLFDPRITALAAAYRKTNAQILIRWSLQHGMIVLPKSRTQHRIAENIAVFDFEISKTDMESLDGLNENYKALFK